MCDLPHYTDQRFEHPIYKYSITQQSMVFNKPGAIMK